MYDRCYFKHYVKVIVYFCFFVLYSLMFEKASLSFFGFIQMYLLVKILLCVPFSSLDLLELNYGTSGPKLFASKCS